MPGTEYDGEDWTGQRPVGQAGLGTVPVVSGFGGAPAPQHGEEPGASPSPEPNFLVHLRVDKEDEAGQYLLLWPARGLKSFLLHPLTHVLFLVLEDP